MNIALIVIACCATLVVGGFMLYGKYQMSKIPELSFADALQYTTLNNPDAIISVAYIKEGEVTYKVFGENGRELENEGLHTYEIGSITKTFTAALINKAIKEGKIDIEETIDVYLDLPKENEYPTIKELMTHTSGYKSYYFEGPMIFNFFERRNDFYGVSKKMIVNKIGNLNMDKAVVSGKLYPADFGN